MKNFFLLFSMWLLSHDLLAQQLIPAFTVERPADYEYLSAPDSTGKRNSLEIPDANGTQAQQQNLPYPIIFIHGLWSSSKTWETTTDFMKAQYGMTFGGRFDYCLNYDFDNSKANKNFATTSGADLALFTPTLVAGDFYFINLDVGSNGSFSPTLASGYSVKSNQQAVVKQGLAVRSAISYVLQKTGRDKVILMGHSMGGLAAREYLQNSSIWQTDGKHHVAKLVTTGTPHGGSNMTTVGVAYAADGQSEAVRDLRRSYTYSGNAGVYLFGGIEDLTYMDDQLCCYFYNSDVNCNGIDQTSENIVGLNQKSISTDLDYSCIIGECPNCALDLYQGDGVVNDVSANLKNYKSTLNINLFYYTANATFEIHTDLPKQSYQNMQGLDEPKDYNLAYHIGFDTLYTGFMTVPAGNDQLSPYDFDEYKFRVPAKSVVTTSVGKIINALNFWVYIVNSSYQRIDSAFHPSGSMQSISFNTTLNTGDYYLEIIGIPNSSSYFAPYDFKLSKINVSPVSEITEAINNILIFPNPVKDQLTVDAGVLSEPLNLEISDMLGRSVYSSIVTNNKTIINTEKFAGGVYLIRFSSNRVSSFRKFTKE